MDDTGLQQLRMNSPTDPDAGDVGTELLTYWRTLVKYRFTIAGLALGVALLAAVVVFMMTPIYSATATLKIEADDASKLLSFEQVYNNVGQGSEAVQTQVEIIRSRTLAALVAKRLNLAADPEFDAAANPGLKQRLMRMLGIGRPPSATVADDAVVGQLMGHLLVSPVHLSNLVTVTYESSDPAQAARIANAFANLYIENDLDQKFQMAQKASEWLNEHLSGLKSKLEDSEQKLQDYRDREHIVSVDGQSLSGSGGQLSGLVTNLVTARMQLAEAQSAYMQIKNAQASGASLDSLPVVLKDPVVAQLKQVVADKERNLSDLSSRYGPKHIKMIEAQAELQQAKDSLAHQVAIVVASVQHEYEQNRASTGALAGAVSEVKGSIEQANKKEFALDDLQRDVATNQQVYDTFVQRFKETSASGDLTKPVALVVDPAAQPEVPVRPKKSEVVLVALLIGALLGIVVSFVMERLDNTVRSSDEVGLRLGQPILTTLPLLKGQRADLGRRYLSEPRSQFSEAIRTARTGVLLSAIDVAHKVLVVTSSVPGEGKTTFATNLALSHAQTKRVLLVDADMRRPRLARSLGLDDSLVGLSALVSGEVELKDCVRGIEGSTLEVLTAGSVPPNPLELLLSQRFKDFLAGLASQYDLVIIDSPPLHLVSDAVILATMATGAIFVMKANSTPYQLARRCLRTLQNARVVMFGVVLNQLDYKKAESHYGDYAAYGDRYGKDEQGHGYYTKEA